MSIIELMSITFLGFFILCIAIFTFTADPKDENEIVDLQKSMRFILASLVITGLFALI